jgi:hypothetical protein
MAIVTIRDEQLSIDIRSLDKLWALTSSLTIPLAHVRGATPDATIASEPKGIRGPGAHIPGVLVAGTFHQKDGLVFWDVHDAAKAVVIELEDEKYQRLVIEVDDPRGTAELIEQALIASRRASH